MKPVKTTSWWHTTVRDGQIWTWFNIWPSHRLINQEAEWDADVDWFLNTKSAPAKFNLSCGYSKLSRRSTCKVIEDMNERIGRTTSITSQKVSRCVEAVYTTSKAYCIHIKQIGNQYLLVLQQMPCWACYLCSWKCLQNFGPMGVSGIWLFKQDELVWFADGVRPVCTYESTGWLGHKHPALTSHPVRMHNASDF